MKRPLQLPLAIALALGATNVLALGLGPVHVKSKLNQPLDAEIPVIEGSAHDADGLLVTLAGADDFERIGLSRSHLAVPLDFAVVKNAQGALVVKVTSKEPVRSPYLDILVEANWTKGRLLREYTVLLDPPVTAPAAGRAMTAPLAPSPATVTAAKPSRPVEHAPTMAAVPTPRATPKPARESAPSSRISKGEYGPVAAGETLSAVARTAREGTGASMNQMMLALLKANPNAFYKDNINALKRGAILRVPGADEAKAVAGSEATAQVHAQIEDWRGGRATPTLVADATGARAVPPAATTGKARKAATPSRDAAERLELVPPKTGKDSIAMADQPGHGAGSPAATGELKSELARTKESLTAREQETGELKSKVKELEGLNTKSDRLIGLKNSEIADLQQKLRQLQEKAAATPATPAAAGTAHVVAPPKIAPEAAHVAAPSTVTPEPAPIVATSIAPTPATDAAMHDENKDLHDSAIVAGVPASAAEGKSNDTKTPGSAPTTPSTMTAVTPVNEPVSTTQPLAQTAPTTVAPSPTTQVKPSPKATPASTRPTVVAAPWYEQAWVKPAALVAGILLLLGGFLGLRKRTPVEVLGRGSIADSFGESPLHPENGGADAVGAEETDLLDQLHENPGDLGLHLELLSLYYAERDITKFEAQAAEMRDHVTDVHDPEWQEAEAMGQELAPDNLLFAGALRADHGHVDDEFESHADRMGDHAAFDAELAEQASVHDALVGQPASDHVIGGDRVATPFAVSGSPSPAPADDSTFGFDGLPPLTEAAPAVARAWDPIEPVAEPVVAAPAPFDLDDIGEDAIGTKLDLARAYMDMGDPEGARSMLEEVVAEGNPAQRAEADRLMADIH